MQDIAVYWVTTKEMDRNWHWRRPFRKAHWNLLRLRNCRGSLRTERGLESFSGDTLFIDAENGLQSIQVEPGTRPLVQWCAFFAHLETDLPPSPRVNDVYLLNQLFTRLQLAFEKHGSRAEPTRRWLEALLQLLYESSPGTVRSSGQALRDRVREDARMIDALPGNQWNITELARRGSVSRDHYTRLFRAEFGTSPREYLSRARLSASMELLQNTSLPIKEIATRLGFYDAYHFSRLFKQTCGQSPTAWRKKPAPMVLLTGSPAAR
jgi:AraC-like DNA-binding protein